MELRLLVQYVGKKFDVLEIQMSFNLELMNPTLDFHNRSNVTILWINWKKKNEGAICHRFSEHQSKLSKNIEEMEKKTGKYLKTPDPIGSVK